MLDRFGARGASFLFLLGVLALAPVSGGAAFQATQLPVAYWPLDEAAGPSMDVVGNVTGTWNGGVTTITSPLPPNSYNTASSRAIQVNGAAGDQYIQAANVPALENLQESSYTVSAWYRPTGVPTGTGGDNTANHAVVVKAGYHAGIHYSVGREYIAEHWSNPAPDWRGTGSWGVAHNENGPWYHVVQTWDRPSGFVRLYVTPAGGATTLYTSTDYPDNEPAREYDQTPWRFGIAAPGSAQWRWAAIGQIDDVRFYNYALNASQVAVLASGVPAPSNVTATGIPDGIQVSWNPPPQGGVTYTYSIVRVDPGSGTRTPLASGLTGTTYTDMFGTLATYSYEVTATSVAVSGPGVSNADSSVNYPPRFNDHEEGTKDGNCGCGASGAGRPVWILGALALAGLFLVRRR
jgi:MYXO-CTERM domain-containing protein